MSISSKAGNPVFQERLLRETLGLCRERGASSWTMDDLARRVGISRMTLYKMAASKEEVLREAVLAGVRGVQAQLGDIIRQEAPYGQRLDRMLEAFPRLVAQTGGRAFGEIFHLYPGVEALVRTHLDDLTREIVRFFDLGASSGQLRPGLDGRLLLEVLKGVVLHWIALDRNGQAITAPLGAALQLILQGALA